VGDDTCEDQLVEPMLSFEISAIDVVLSVVVVVLIVLYVSQQKGKAVAEQKLPARRFEEKLEKLKTKAKDKSEEPTTRPSPAGFSTCKHNFGHLRKLPPNTPVPDECFGCPKVTRCLFPKEQDLVAR